MCGIFGAIHTTGLFESDDALQFKALTDLVHYRGPNDCGYQTLSIKQTRATSNGGFDVFLGGRRLSILDLSPAGHQPMTDGKGRWITYNGEIFNFIELRSELQAKGHTFKTQTDTEVILHIYDEYGEAGFAKLNGMWGFALVDHAGQRVVLSRDRFSIKPLYLLVLSDKLYFGSEIKQLVPLLPSKELNGDVMLDFLQQGLFDHTRETFFRRIVKLQPRTNLTICMRTGKMAEKPYWDFSPIDCASPEIASEIFRELFLDSVKTRLRSDVPVGVLLSGGLDSSAIAVATSLVSNGQVETYSIVSTSEKYSERKFIDVLAKKGLRNQQIVFEPADALQDLNAALDHSDEPFGGFSVLAQYKLFETIKRATPVTVLLSGQGGDEILMGYLKFFFFNLRNLMDRHKYQSVLYELLMSLFHRTAVTQFRVGDAKRYLRRSAAKKAPFLCEMRPPAAVWQHNDLRSRQILDIEKYSVPALTHYEDRNSMAHSLEVRHPFLDHRLVNFAIGLPSSFKIRNGWTKHLLRQSMPELPDMIRWRRDKQSFIVPEELWLKRDFSRTIEKAFQKSRLGEMHILNDKAFLNYYAHFKSGKPIPPTTISRIFIAEKWIQGTFN